MRMMTAYDAMVSILDINENLEELKSRNTDVTPDLTLCKTTGLLMDYRSVLGELLKNTEIKFGGAYDSQRVENSNSF